MSYSVLNDLAEAMKALEGKKMAVVSSAERVIFGFFFSVAADLDLSWVLQCEKRLG